MKDDMQRAKVDGEEPQITQRDWKDYVEQNRESNLWHGVEEDYLKVA